MQILELLRQTGYYSRWLRLIETGYDNSSKCMNEICALICCCIGMIISLMLAMFCIVMFENLLFGEVCFIWSICMQSIALEIVKEVTSI